MGNFFRDVRILQRICLLSLFCVSITECIHRRLHMPAPSRNLSGFGSEMGPEMLVHVLRGRGDNSAETNAHRIILSVDTASNFINDVLESAMTKTYHSAISSRENLFFSLQRINNDSRRIFELVDRATTVVSETAKKAKTEINDAIKTSLDHLRESMKIIIRNVPESKLTEISLGAIIANGQYRMEVVVENSGQRIIDAIQSYRSHFIAIDKATGNLMVDPESSQEATEAVKHIITAAKSQIQEAVSGSTSFILSRIRECLASNLNDDHEKVNSTTSSSVTLAFNGSLETFQADVISVHPTQMEDSADDKLVQMGDIPKHDHHTPATSTTTWELPMIINTKWTTTTTTVAPSLDTTTTAIVNGTGNTTIQPSTSRLVSWQDDIPKGAFPAGLEGAITDGDFAVSTHNSTTTESSLLASGSSSDSTWATTVTSVTQGPVMRRRIQPIKPILSGRGSS